MIVCICNNISESAIRADPSLLKCCATQCAKCSETVAQLRSELAVEVEQLTHGTVQD